MVRTFETTDDMLELIVQHFGITDEPYNGPTYILPNGYFLDLRKCNHHSEVEKWLIDNGLSNYTYIKTAGSQTITDLGCIRCDTLKYYIYLTDKQPTREQYNTLLVWLDHLARTTRFVEVLTPTGDSVMYPTVDNDEYNVDYIVDRIRRYYSSGRLYEQNSIVQKHQYKFIYTRNKVGKGIAII